MKRFIPSIYIKEGIAVRGLNDATCINNSPYDLAKSYKESGADAIIVLDLSDSDQNHEIHIDIIRDICEGVDIDIIGLGNIKREEDVKKFLYAGCKAVGLNFSKEGNVALTEIVSKRFGADKIMACILDSDELKLYQDILSDYCSAVVLLPSNSIRESVLKSPIPAIVALPDVALDKFLEIITLDAVIGVTGYYMNENISEYKALKGLINEALSENICEEDSKVIEWSKLKKCSDGLIPVIVQDYITSDILMLAYMNEEAYNRTIKLGNMTYYSRSRQELWLKGETSGHYQYLKELITDCDMDTLLARVEQVGVACHTGKRSCFYNDIISSEYEKAPDIGKVLTGVQEVIVDRKKNPKEGSYTNYLFDKGIDKILKKIGEESTEIVIAAKNHNKNETMYEVCDLLYHLSVLMANEDITWEQIATNLSKR